MAETKPIRFAEDVHREVKTLAAQKGLGLSEYAEIAIKRGIACDKRKKDAA